MVGGALPYVGIGHVCLLVVGCVPDRNRGIEQDVDRGADGDDDDVDRGHLVAGPVDDAEQGEQVGDGRYDGCQCCGLCEHGYLPSRMTMTTITSTTTRTVPMVMRAAR